MRVSIIFVILVSSFLFNGMLHPTSISAQQKNEIFHFSVLRSSTITINGSSNVNKFNCVACSPTKSTNIQATRTNSKIIKLKGSIVMPVQNFNCQNRILNKDLRKTLKEDEYPNMTIHFIDIERTTNNAEIEQVKGTVQIELAGKRKQFSIPYTINRTEKTIRLEGNRAFTFQDFDLSPPKKIAGMIKVKDDFNVNFTLFLTASN